MELWWDPLPGIRTRVPIGSPRQDLNTSFHADSAPSQPRIDTYQHRDLPRSALHQRLSRRCCFKPEPPMHADGGYGSTWTPLPDAYAASKPTMAVSRPENQPAYVSARPPFASLKLSNLLLLIWGFVDTDLIPRPAAKPAGQALSNPCALPKDVGLRSRCLKEQFVNFVSLHDQSQDRNQQHHG